VYKITQTFYLLSTATHKMSQPTWCASVLKQINSQQSNNVGEGRFGVIYTVRNDNQKEIICKKFKYKKSEDKGVSENELQYMKKFCQIDNFAQLINSFYDDDRLYMLITKYSGDLSVYDGPTDKRIKYIECIYEALKHMHENDLVHLDIRPENMFYDADTSNAYLGDFGYTRKSSTNAVTDDFRKEHIGAYSPLITNDKQMFEKTIDIFCFAFSIWFILIDIDGQPPNIAKTQLMQMIILDTEITTYSRPSNSGMIINGEKLISKLCEYKDDTSTVFHKINTPFFNLPQFATICHMITHPELSTIDRFEDIFDKQPIPRLRKPQSIAVRKPQSIAVRKPQSIAGSIGLGVLGVAAVATTVLATKKHTSTRSSRKSQHPHKRRRSSRKSQHPHKRRRSSRKS
jgi:serine/threonine protein kinase